MTKKLYHILLLSSLLLAVSCEEEPVAMAPDSVSPETAFLDEFAHQFPRVIRNGNVDVAERMSRLYFDIKDDRVDSYSGDVLPMGAILTLDPTDGSFSILAHSYYATEESIPSAIQFSFRNGEQVTAKL